MVVAAALLAPCPGRSATLAAGLVAEVVCDGITGATALVCLPDGRLLIGEQTGAIRVVKENRLMDLPAITLPTDSTWERGVLGLALDPAFPTAPHLFVHWTVAAPWPHFRISRFTLAGDTLDPASERIVFEGENQSEIRADVPAGHQGGGITFGADGKLYVAVGEMTTQMPSQRLDSLLGKILRIEPDGEIPADNPFFAKAQGKYRAIYALGLRNPWTISVHPRSGRMLVNDIGASAYEEVNEIVAGGNFGWPEAEGRVEMNKFRDPVIDYGRRIGQSLGGGCFYHAPPGARYSLSAALDGRYLLMDFMAGWLGVLNETSKPHPTVDMIAKDLAKPVAAAVATDGSLYVLERNTWVKDETFQPKQGRLLRLRPGTAAVAKGAFPARWSEAGFEKESLPYRVLVEPWRPGASVERRLKLPAGQKLTVSPDRSSFALPAGTVLITHLSSVGRRVLSTVILATAKGPHQAAAYRWRNGDADLIRETAVVTVDGRGWIFPGPTDQLTLPPITPGYDIDLSPANLPQGELSAVVAGKLPALRLTKLEDANASVESRVRSFLDVNCASCHRPGGVGRGLYDARFSTPLERQQLINGPLVSGELGVPGAKAIVPAAPAQSMLLLRLKKPPGDPMRMPPGCLFPETPPVLPLLEMWIRGMK